jgi:hypothetical protein
MIDQEPSQEPLERVDSRWAVTFFWQSLVLCLAGWGIVFGLTSTLPSAVTIPILYLVYPAAWAWNIIWGLRRGRVACGSLLFSLVFILPVLLIWFVGKRQIKGNDLLNAAYSLCILGILPIIFMWLLGFMEGLPYVCFTDPRFCFR